MFEIPEGSIVNKAEGRLFWVGGPAIVWPLIYTGEEQVGVKATAQQGNMTSLMFKESEEYHHYKFMGAQYIYGFHYYGKMTSWKAASWP